MKEQFEYELYQKTRKYKIPFLLRFLIFILLTIIAIPQILLPIFPGSFFTGLIMFVFGVILVIPAQKIKYLIKIRKGLTYLVKNFKNKKAWEYKSKDIKNHTKKIIK